jgi:diguanylate cyclase (GGDEF)-like protein
VTIKVAPKFFLVLAVLAVAILALAGLAVRGLDSERTDVEHLYAHNLVTSQLVSRLSEDLRSANTIALELRLARDVSSRRPLRLELDGSVRPAVAQDLAALHASVGIDSPEERANLAMIDAGWQRFERLARNGSFDSVPPPLQSLTVHGSRAKVLEAIFDPLTARAKILVNGEATQAKSANDRAARIYSSSRTLMIVIACAALFAGLGIVVWLIRNVVPRVRTYSRFASAIARGDLTQRLAPKGSDELTDLGVALNHMVDRREEAIERDERQAEFVDALQMTVNEDESHDLIKRHLERSVPSSSVTVLNRNNSRDRLEPVTSMATGGRLLDALTDAEPRTCLAVRFARSHEHGADGGTLIQCEICGKAGDRSTCQPLLVGGEVIGSVLVQHPAPLHDSERDCIKGSVTQAAPVLANLRTLAIAELRAATDSLTGLPNKRSVESDLKRMVAHASRAVSPLAAVLLDLDHFKHVNDTYGHVKGDEALAAVGAVLQTSLRESDFAGRYGGEEFVILLPDTSAAGARIIGEKLRTAIAAIKISDVERGFTASLGIAVFPDDAADGETLVRHADRALYLAKSNGRNRIEIFATRTDDKAHTDLVEAGYRVTPES